MVDEKNGTNGTSAPDEVPLSERTLWQKCLAYWKLISVEPVVFCWFVPFVFSYIAVQNLQLEKVRGLVVARS